MSAELKRLVQHWGQGLTHRVAVDSDERIDLKLQSNQGCFIMKVNSPRHPLLLWTLVATLLASFSTFAGVNDVELQTIVLDGGIRSFEGHTNCSEDVNNGCLPYMVITPTRGRPITFVLSAPGHGVQSPTTVAEAPVAIRNFSSYLALAKLGRPIILPLEIDQEIESGVTEERWSLGEEPVCGLPVITLQLYQTFNRSAATLRRLVDEESNMDADTRDEIWERLDTYSDTYSINWRRVACN